MRPIYRDSRAPQSVGDGHRGLWFDRFFHRYGAGWTLDETAKPDWIKTVTGPVGDRQAIEAATAHLRRLCEALGGDVLAYAGTWHFATGLGNPHPVENGFLWHPTLGVPYIPGAALKGLVRAWVETWMGFDDEAERRTTLYRWFGSEDKDPTMRRKLRADGFRPSSPDSEIDTEAGALIFFDALPLAPIMLKADVMTPHMGKWYAEGDEIMNVDEEPQRVPADWHDPVPVPFLVADRPKVQICIAPRNETAKQEMAQVLEALDNALNLLGAGAKTAVGYGRLNPDEAENKRIEKAREEETRSRLPLAERLRAEAQALTEEQLAERLGKDRTKTRQHYGSEWDAFLDQVAAVHGQTLQIWKDEKNKHRKRAYRTVFQREKEE
jgi:CRISPR-associated protein Cmr6